VICLICGFKFRSDLWLHLKRHVDEEALDGLTIADYQQKFPEKELPGLTPKAYHRRFPGAPMLPLGTYDGKNELARGYGRKKRKLAIMGKKIEDLQNAELVEKVVGGMALAGIGGKKTVPAVQAVTGESISVTKVERIRTKQGLSGKKGRPAKNKPDLSSKLPILRTAGKL